MIRNRNAEHDAHSLSRRIVEQITPVTDHASIIATLIDKHIANKPNAMDPIQLQEPAGKGLHTALMWGWMGGARALLEMARDELRKKETV